MLGGGESLREFGVEPRDRLPDRRRHPRLHRPDDRDRQGRRHRSARRDADAAADPRRAGGRGRSRARSPAARRRARSSVSPQSGALERSREIALDYAESARACAERLAPRRSSTLSSPRSWSGEAERRDAPPGPHLVREHGAGLFPARRAGRRGSRRADRAERAAARGRARHRADLVDRIREERRSAAHPAAPLRLVRRRGRLDPARLEDASRARAHGRGDAGVGDVGRADEGAAARGDARPARRARPTRRS